MSVGSLRWSIEFVVNQVLSPAGKSTEPTNWQRWCRRGILICLTIQFLVACDTGRRLTPTHDEYWHLPLGLLIWKTGRFDYDVINPALLRLWAALPLVLGGAKLDLDVPFTGAGTTGDLFWTANPEDRMLFFACGRIMVAIMNGATGWLVAIWGRRWFGDFAGLAAAMLWCFCPTVLANGSLVTHDAAAAFGFVSTLYALVCWCEQPTGRRAAIVGFCLGIAQLLKVTCVLLFPLAVITWLLIRPISIGTGQACSRWKNGIVQWLIVFGLAIVVINVGYLGHQTCQSLKSMAFASKRFQTLQQVDWLRSLPLPVPRSYVQAFDRVAQDLQNQHPVFLDSRWSVTGFRDYYVKALGYKLSLGSWSMFVMSIVYCWSQRRSKVPKRVAAITPKNPVPSKVEAIPEPIKVQGRDDGKKSVGIPERHFSAVVSGPYSTDWRKQLVLIIPVLMLVIPASMGSNQIGIRYIFPVLPLIYLFAAQAANGLSSDRWRWPQWLVLLALISLPTSLRYHPHHLTYFNEWAGGPMEGKRLLIDSNLDWGQDLHGLAAYLREEKLEKIGIAYFGTVHPHSLGIRYSLPPTKQPQPGDYAVSVNFEAGRPFIIRSPTPDGEPPTPTKEQPIPLSEPYVADFEDFGYFRFFRPRAHIGYSIYLYHLTADDVAAYNQAVRRARRL